MTQETVLKGGSCDRQDLARVDERSQHYEIKERLDY
jgi:hypothetical protein